MLLENLESVSESQEEVKPGAEFCVETPEEAPEDTRDSEPVESFRNELIVNPEAIYLTPDTAEPTGEYAGPSLQQLEWEIEEATRDLENARARLDEAMANGDSVLTAMSIVESCESILESRMNQYSQAVAAQSREAASLSAGQTPETGEVKLGSVSHKQWELEQAIKSGNSIAIEHKQRDLAHEIAKEEAKKQQKK